MSAQDKIAEAIHRGSGCLCEIVATPTSHTQAVIDAIRAMTPAEQAELLDGSVDEQPEHECPTGCCRWGYAARVVGPWRPVEDA